MVSAPCHRLPLHQIGSVDVNIQSSVPMKRPDRVKVTGYCSPQVWPASTEEYPPRAGLSA